MVCTKTIYNYVEKGKIKTKNINLPNKVRRRVKSDRPTQKRKKLTIGRTIEERNPIVNER